MTRNKSSSAPTLEAESITQRAYAAIKLAIIRCDLAPSSEISAGQLSQHFNFGLGPVRAALSRLEQDGLVRAVPRRGHIVAPITLKSVTETFELRMLLEPYAARRAAGNIDPTKLEFLHEICSRDYDPADPKSRLEYLQANRAFHVFIAESAGNSLLTARLAQTLDEMTRILYIGLGLRNRTDEMRNEHRALVDALVANDPAEAERLSALEIQSARRMVLDAILSSRLFQNLPLSLLNTEITEVCPRTNQISFALKTNGR